MIVWVNGAFGSGKTTLVEELRGRWPEALVFDPERVGQLLREVVPEPPGDFQDIPLWRRQVAQFAVALVGEYGRPLLVPMTLVDPDYVREIFGAIRDADVVLHHFFLRVPPELLAERIDGRVFFPGDPDSEDRVRDWCKGRIPACVSAAATMPPDTVFLDGRLSPGELADGVLTRVG